MTKEEILQLLLEKKLCMTPDLNECNTCCFKMKYHYYCWDGTPTQCYLVRLKNIYMKKKGILQENEWSDYDIAEYILNKKKIKRMKEILL